MNALFSDPAVGVLLAGALLTVFWWLWRGHSKRLHELELDAVRKQELAKELEILRDSHREDMEQLRDESAARHRENSGKLNNIEAGVQRTHERIDAFFLKLMNTDGGKK
jgi:hypothetical protein